MLCSIFEIMPICHDSSCAIAINIFNQSVAAIADAIFSLKECARRRRRHMLKVDDGFFEGVTAQAVSQ